MLREYRELMRAIADVLSGMEDRASLDLEQVERLNAELTEYLSTVNRRLNLAYEWLQKGYRALALEECEQRPALLELVGLLDQPELAQWRELVDNCGFTPPPKLATDLAAELSEAYNAEEALGPLLRRFRRQNLQRAPLAERLATLRQICERDPEVVEFREDLDAFEAERLREIEGELAQAVRVGSVEELERLHAELSNQPWTNPRAESLLRSINKHLERLRAVRAREDLNQLQHALLGAWQARDRERATVLAQRWHELAATAALDPADPLRKTVQPALEWVEAQEAAARLEQALEENAPAAEVERLAYLAKRFGHPLPPALELRVNQCLESHRAAQRARFLLAMGAGVAVTLALLMLIGWRIMVWKERRELEQVRDTMAGLLQNGQWEEVEEVAQDYQDRHADGPLPAQLMQLLAEARSRMQEEDKRQEQFQQQVRAFRQLLDRRTCEAIEQAERDLEKLRRHAGAFERSAPKEEALQKCAELEAALEERRLEVQRKALAQFREALRKLQARERATEDDPAKLASLLSEAEKLRDSSSCVPESVRGAQSELAMLIARVSLRIKNLRAEREQRELLERVTTAVGDPEAYRQTLDEYRTKFPDDRRSRDFARAIRNQLSVLKTMDQWNQIWQQLLARDVLKLDVQTAQATLERLAALPHQSLVSSLHSTCEGHVELVRRVASRPRLSRSVQAIDRFLKSNVIFRAPVYVTRDGKRYYVSRARRNQQLWTITYYVSYDGPEVAQVEVLHRDILHRWTNQDGAKSPEARWAEELRASLSEVEKDWEGGFVGCVRLVERADLDPIVKLIMLRQLLGVGTSGSAPLERVYGPVLRELRAIDMGNNVLDPANPGTAVVRKRAEKVFAQLPDEPEARVTNEATRLGETVPRVEWIGWLSWDADRGWLCSAPRDLPNGLALYVAEENRQGEPERLVSIGVAAGGNVVKVDQRPGLYEGMLVFSVASPQ